MNVYIWDNYDFYRAYENELERESEIDCWFDDEDTETADCADWLPW